MTNPGISERGVIVCFLIALFVFTSSAVYSVEPTSISTKMKDYQVAQFSQLKFINNDDLLSKAEQYHWKGTGTEDDPIIIERMTFNNREHMFVVSHTDLHILFCNNSLEGVDHEWCAIVIWEAENVQIVHNTVKEAAVAVHLWGAKNCVVRGNLFFDLLYDGVYFEDNCSGHTIVSNKIYDCAEAGICVSDESTDNVIEKNEVFGSPYGIFIDSDASHNEITFNNIHDCTHSGIRVDSNYNDISKNHITNITGKGIRISGNRTNITDCVISENGIGIHVLTQTQLNEIRNCEITNNIETGVELIGNQTLVKNSDFTGNGINHARDSGKDNEFVLNYWDDWTTPDDDADSIVDISYQIPGDGVSTDLQPRTTKQNHIEDWQGIGEYGITIEADTFPVTEIGFVGTITGIIVCICFLRRRKN